MKIIIAGGGAAALSVAEELVKQNNNSKKLEISVYSKENCLPYYRPFLSKSCGLNIPISNFYLKKQEWYDKNNIKIYLEKTLTRVENTNKKITINDSEKESYDKLVLATGSHGFKLPNIDYNTKGIFQLNEYSDVEKLTKYINDNSCKKALVIGGGILGCESANALTRFKCEVYVVEMMQHIMPRMLSKKTAIYLTKIIENHKIKIITNDLTTSIKREKELFNIELKSGKKFQCDIIIVNVGVRPNIDYLKNTDIKINRGILCNEYLQTSDKDIFVAGDILEFPGYPTIMLWEPALIQGTIIANNILSDANNYRKYNFADTFAVTYNSFNTMLVCIGNPSDINDNTKEIIVDRNISETKKGKTFINYNGEKIVFAASFNDNLSARLIKQLPNKNFSKDIFTDFIRDNIK